MHCNWHYAFPLHVKFQHKPRYHLSKNPRIKIDLLLLFPRDQKPLSYYILYNEYKHNIFALVGKANKGRSAPILYKSFFPPLEVWGIRIP
jgi:hypothetical protein